MPNKPALDKKITSLLDDYTTPDLDELVSNNTDDDLDDDVKEALNLDNDKDKPITTLGNGSTEDYISEEEQAAMEEIDSLI